MTNQSMEFSTDFDHCIRQFSKDAADNYINNNLENRFLSFRKKFEKAFSEDLEELDNSGLYECFIPQYLDTGVKNLMDALLETYGFVEILPHPEGRGFTGVPLEYYFVSGLGDDRTYFCVCKTMPDY